MDIALVLNSGVSQLLDASQRCRPFANGAGEGASQRRWLSRQWPVLVMPMPPMPRRPASRHLLTPCAHLPEPSFEVRTSMCMCLGVREHVHVYTVRTSMCMSIGTIGLSCANHLLSHLPYLCTSIGAYEHVRVYTVRTSEHRCVCVSGFERPSHQTLVLSRALGPHAHNKNPTGPSNFDFFIKL